MSDRANPLPEDRVLIPEGPFLARGQFGEDGAVQDPPRKARLPAFFIDRTPVTVGDYAAFIEAGGYRTRSYWSRDGWAFRTEERLTRPRFWGEEEWAAYLVPTHPVVGVSFHEAEAYAEFRGARLPTELEWEKAARGTDGRRYPWGDTWLPDACGSRGVGPRGTVPIGTYPKGRSPFGLLDVVGCVWQWCSDEYDEGDDKRVTRGGGWNNLPWSISCTSRNGYPPDAQFSNLGFRCAADVR